MDEALRALERISPRQSKVIELRYFGGLSVEETAEAMHVSTGTVRRDWSMARAWLFRELSNRRPR
jgi:RNA polymerase sigma factor (sigma-70 family)